MYNYHASKQKSIKCIYRCNIIIFFILLSRKLNKNSRIMTPTRKQFKDLITSIKKAQEKEDNLDKAFELIWDDEQGQYPPFYISPL